jgi:DNA-binding MarR family transcriptional regulator
MSEENTPLSPFLIARMLEGWDWFDNRLREQQRKHGYRVLNKTQSMLMIYVASGVTRPAEIARKISLSRQAVLHIAHGLIEMGILEARTDPDDRRSIILGFTKNSFQERLFAEQVFKALEARLEQKLGPQDMKTFRRLLALAWSDDAPVRREKRARPSTAEHQRK